MSSHKLRQAGALPAAKPKYKATIVIGLLPTGQVQVTGPLHYKDLCEQMLNEAFSELKKFHARSEAEEQNPEPSIIVPERKIFTVQ